MQWTDFGMGLAAIAVGAIAPVVSASELPSTPPSMSQEDLPPLEVPLRPSPATDTPMLADVIMEPPLADVPPNHWAYPAVINLVEGYGCMVGYPDRTFRGDQLLTRYEFAAAMNACLDTLRQLAAQEQPTVTLDDLLQELADLEAELGTLSGEDDTTDSDSQSQQRPTH